LNGSLRFWQTAVKRRQNALGPARASETLKANDFDTSQNVSKSLRLADSASVLLLLSAKDYGKTAK
jgi:hypothetical protein